MKKSAFLIALIISIFYCFAQTSEGLSNKIYITKNPPIADKVKMYVEDKVLAWEQKGKYETLAQYQERVNPEKREQKIKKHTSEALAAIGMNEFEKNKNTITTNYDAESQLFKINIKAFESIYLSVPLSQAEIFDNNLDNLVFFDRNYSFNENNLIITKASVKNPANGKIYYYDASKPVKFNSVIVENTFKPVDIDINIVPKQIQQVSTNTKKISVGNSDVDINIPYTNIKNDKTFAVIIGNENYKNEIQVKYAINDAKTFKDYVVKTLGVPEKQVHYSINATYGTILGEIEWLNNISKGFKGEAKILFYYAGHGMPDQSSKSAYLLPVDGMASNSATAIKIDDLYSKLTEYSSISVTVFLDACFSGGSRDGMLASGRGVKIKPEENTLKGNLVVFTAVSGDQTAHPYKEKQHGLFTYYLLKKLQETKGNVDYKTLSNYISTKVNQQSIINNKEQTPKVNVSNNIQYTWENWTLKIDAD
ncbi:MAG: caspase family protein [Bacteroidales bacterium]|nr:caspase family protein [Bacteroidales bacterium]